uniref:Uncharacterized protein n=1 Tax=Photinus pyralis TaxID=7054 RepID=A0A1Y1LA39_PHOPY
MISYEESTDDVMWNEESLSSKEGLDMLQNKVNCSLEGRLTKTLQKNVCDNENCTFIYVSIKVLLLQCHKMWTHRNLQMVGKLKIDNDVRLYSLYNEKDFVLLYLCSNALKHTVNAQMYALVYGFPKFYVNNEDNNKHTTVMVHVTSLVKLDNLSTAQKMESHLCKFRN